MISYQNGADKMKKLLSILLAALFAASVFTSCSSDGSSSSAGSSNSDENQSQATVEQLEKFEPGWWWIFETNQYKSDDGKEQLSYSCYLVKYDSNYEHTGEYFGEARSGWDGNPEKLVCSETVGKTKWRVTSDYDLKAHNASWFPPINYKAVSKYIDKEFGRPDKDDGWYIYTKYILKKASSKDNYFPTWITETK